MALLLQTNIEKQVTDKIRGDVVRVGSLVKQLVDYKNCRVTDINIVDGGFGQVKKIKHIKSIRNIYETSKRYAKQKFLHLWRGDEIGRDWKTIIMDAHETYEHEELRHRFDACITSNVLEHSPNPVFLLLNFYFLTKKSGYQYHAIPHYKYTFDMFRRPTTVKHLLEDFGRRTKIDDTSHNKDYIQSAIVKHGYFRKFHETHPVTYPYIHFHVFDEHNVRELFETMFEDVTNDIIKSEFFSDNLVLFRNKLNKKFINKFRATIATYSEKFLEDAI